MSFYKEFEERGFVKQVTDEAIKEKIDKERLVFYTGYDPTAKSLHVGHLLAIMAMRRLQKAGHKPIVIIGGGTTMVGDPSGKITMRKMLSKEEIKENAELLKKQFSRFLTFGDGASDAVMINNADWLCSLNLLDFLRDIGVHFSVNRMLTYDSVTARLEKGMTFLEFSYNLLQAYDFYHLYKHFGCKLQMGGDDQWANITAGMDLIRRKEQGEAYGLTNPLLTTAAGHKMGKTESGAVWLDPEMTSPYEFFQYLVNCDDKDVSKLLRLFTDLPLERIYELEALEGAGLREAKKVLAYEVTKLVHGQEEADKAVEAAAAAFGANKEITPETDLPTAELPRSELESLPPLAAVLADKGVLSSRGECRRLIKGGGVYVNNERVSDPEIKLTPGDVDKYGQIIVRLGKKNYHRIKIV